MSGSLILNSLDGANPLAFLAALGVLRLLDDARGATTPRLGWIPERGWRPVLEGTDLTGADLCVVLAKASAQSIAEFSMLGKNLTVEPARFREFATACSVGMSASNRRKGDFAGAFGSELCKNPRREEIQYTSFCFITGSGHQDFLGTHSKLCGQITPELIREALFGVWRYRDKGLSFGWDPADAREYALRWSDPGPEGVWTVWGANRLAFEALRLLPAQPTGHKLATTGFSKGVFTWPIWQGGIACDTIQSLLALSELQDDSPNRAELKQMGVVDVYRANRVHIGSGANYKVRFRPPHAV